MEVPLYQHYIYQVMLGLLVAVILISAGSVAVKKLLIKYEIPFIKRRFLNIFFFVGVIPLWIEIIHFIPFNGEHIAKILVFLPEKAELFLIQIFNNIFPQIYSSKTHIFSISYILCFLGIIFLPYLIENITDKRIRFVTYTVASGGFYPIYAGISFLYNPRVIQQLRFGTKVFRDPVQAEKAIRNLVRLEKCNGIKIHENIELPCIRESQHIFLIGGPGSGKTNAIYKIVETVRNRGDRMIIYDRKGDYTEAFGEKERVIILSPFDQRGYAWNIAKDINTEILADEFAASLIPTPKEAKESQWYEAAQDLLTGVIMRLQAEKKENWNFNDLRDILSDKKSVIESCQAYLPGALQTIGDIDDKQTAGVFMNLRIATKKIRFLAIAWTDAEKKFSLTEWLDQEDHPIRTVIIGGNSKYAGLDNFLITQFMNMTYNEVLSFPDSFSRRIWAINDEQGSQPPVKNLLRALAEGRSKGLCIVSAVQDIGQIRDKYGRDQAHTWFTNYGAVLGGRVSDPDTAAFLARAFGQNRVVKTSVSVTEELDRISRSSQEHNEAALLDSDFLNLPNASLKNGASFWLRIAGWPAAKLKYKITPLPKEYRAQIPMEWLTKAPVKTTDHSQSSETAYNEYETIQKTERTDVNLDSGEVSKNEKEDELAAIGRELGYESWDGFSYYMHKIPGQKL
ncbi:MAG: type IV secretion system DNA-binding domain-containing protein [Deltaproteobacteria bacterium]|nr:type IV secretion system DNA-binding domain-containing protein [Deltaproteobacteria bacterium]